MSGGVDSAVATGLAVAAGADAVGVTMRLWSPGAGELSQRVRQCCGPTAYDDARRSAARFGIAHYVINFEAAFERAVVDYFCAEYRAGRTPNPCVACNNLIKFGALLDFARALGTGRVVTGHYARVRQGSAGLRLLRAADASKDQSYMLAGLRPEQLADVDFPLGDYSKEDTRELARGMGLGVADKPDSMDLCFVDADYRGFITRRFPDALAPGPILTTDGEIVGTHDGLINFTVGQRKGITASAHGDGPWYVVRIDRERNAVTVGRRDALAKTRIECSAANVLRADAFADGAARGLAVCRYRSRPLPASARLEGCDRLVVELDEPVPMASPGQLLVMYDIADEEVLASGIIEG